MKIYRGTLLFSLFIISFFCIQNALAEAGELKVINTKTDNLNMTHEKFNQELNGVPVFGGEKIVHKNPDGSIKSISGKTLSRIDINTEPTLSEQEAIDIANQLWQEQFDIEYDEIKKSDLYIYNKNLFAKHREDKNYLIWRVEIFKQEPGLHEFYFIDAHSGELVNQITGMQDVVNRNVWDCSPDAITCYLDTAYLGYTYGRSEGQVARGVNPNIYSWLTSLYDTDTLYTYFGSLYNYYYDNYGLNGANHQGGMGDGAANFPIVKTSGLTYIDYYISEALYCPNAFFNSANSVHFCDGYVTSDITGHEYAHAVDYFLVTDANGAAAGLTYQDESGALNEANSDVFGEAFEYYYEGSNNWLIGEDLDGGPFRSMISPSDYSYTGDAGTAVPYPDKFHDENYYCGTGDSGGVHYNSSVVNHAAYLMAMGGTYNGCTITGIGRTKEEAIFFRALNVYYTTSTDFNGAYTALITACGDLYGASSTDCLQVTKALMAVEMDQAGQCSGGTAVAPSCDALDNAPTITNVSSDTKNGYYKKGKKVDIDVTFSEAVTSTGDVTVKMNTGGQCTFTVANSTTGTCKYKAKKSHNTKDLNVKKISGTITDAQGTPMTNFSPTTNLKKNKAIVIDNKKPKIPKKIKIYTDKAKSYRIKTINPRKYTKLVKHYYVKPYITWSKATDSNSGISKYYVKFTKKKITRKKLLNYKNKKKKKKRFIYKQIDWDTEYKLYMIVKDKAGNSSKKKRVLRYKAI